MLDLDKVIHLIIKQGLREDTEHKRGILFMVRHKNHFENGKVKGFISGSFNSVKLNVNSCSHWTPNLFANGTYTSNSRTYIKGYSEENLRQINTFVVETDSKEYTPGQLVLECVDAGIGEPTLILESDRGYHIYFVLDKPVYVTSQSNYKSLKVAKRISHNLKRALGEVNVDMECNDFLFFRMPNSKNIRYFNEYNTFTFQKLMNWSMQYDDSVGATFRVLQGGKSKSNNCVEWIQELIKHNQIKGSKGRLGRNNIIFTLALSCFEQGMSDLECFNIVDEYNSTLQFPISNKAIKSIIKSAYSGKYAGASEDYIANFYETYTNKKYVKKGNRTNWYKFKKARVDRQRSHYTEWENDLNKYINSKVEGNKFIELTQSELCEQVGISRSTLNELLKQSRIIIKSTVGKGRYAITRWTTVSTLFNYALNVVRNRQANYNLYLLELLSEIELECEVSYATNYVKTLVNGLLDGNEYIKERLLI